MRKRTTKPSRRPVPRPPARADAASRVRHLLALDAVNVIRRLTARRQEMVVLFSRLRDRGPLLSASESWFPTATFGELAALEPAEQRAVNQFYELLGELRWYLLYTQDMPLQLQGRIDAFVERLETDQRLLLAVLGHTAEPGRVEVEREVVPLHRPRRLPR